MKRHLLIALTSLAALSLSAVSAIAATPPPQPGCPDGWVPRPPNLNPALGECMPDTTAPAPGGGRLQTPLPATIILPKDGTVRDTPFPVKTDVVPMVIESDNVPLHHR